MESWALNNSYHFTVWCVFLNSQIFSKWSQPTAVRQISSSLDLHYIWCHSRLGALKTGSLFVCGVCWELWSPVSGPEVFDATDWTQHQWLDALQYVSGSSPPSLRTYDGLSQRPQIRLRSKYNACFETYTGVQSAGLMSCLSLLSVAHWKALSFVVIGASWCLWTSPVLEYSLLNLDLTLYSLTFIFSDNMEVIIIISSSSISISSMYLCIKCQPVWLICMHPIIVKYIAC